MARISGFSVGPALAAYLGMITDEDYFQIAETLIRRHGANAILWADLAIDDLDSKGEIDCASLWRSLREVICDLVASDNAPAELVLN